MGPCYRALLASGYDVWKRCRNSLVHEYAVREDILVLLPARQVPCGIFKDTTTGQHAIGCGRYFADFYAACAMMYTRHTGKVAPPMP